ncbi:MAG TPA: VWA domain-containing protein [Candidatus Acidoferrum sp.]|nr:VWA domain-containing protein [Candidatus Acidoferrum sp.]
MKAVALVVCLLGCGAAAQEPAPIRVDVGLVNVGFNVRDAAGKLVTDLTQDDVGITEDGVPQKIAFFARSTDVPLNLGLAMDVSGSQQSFIKPHMHDLQTFLKSVLRAQDKAYLMTFANRLSLVSDYSGSAKELVSSLEDFQKAKGRVEYPSVGPRERRILGTAFYDAVFYGSTLMMQNVQRGRRALILFSDGEDNSSAHHMLDAIEAAQANDVLIFAIRYTENDEGQWNARNKYGISVMERIARESGGADFDGRGRGLADSFRQIGEQLRSGYELAYHTTNPPGDQTFHKIVIKPKRPGVTVRAKTGYYAR